MNHLNNYNGVIIPMISPFDTKNNIDDHALKIMLNFYLDSDCIPFILGTTGEAVSMSRAMKNITPCKDC